MQLVRCLLHVSRCPCPKDQGRALWPCHLDHQHLVCLWFFFTTVFFLIFLIQLRLRLIWCSLLGDAWFTFCVWKRCRGLYFWFFRLCLWIRWVVGRRGIIDATQRAAPTCKGEYRKPFLFLGLTSCLSLPFLSSFTCNFTIWPCSFFLSLRLASFSHIFKLLPCSSITFTLSVVTFSLFKTFSSLCLNVASCKGLNEPLWESALFWPKWQIFATLYSIFRHHVSDLRTRWQVFIFWFALMISHIYVSVYLTQNLLKRFLCILHFLVRTFILFYLYIFRFIYLFIYFLGY